MTSILLLAGASAFGRVIYSMLRRPPRPPLAINVLRDVATRYEQAQIGRLTGPQCARVVGAIAPRGEIVSPLSRRPCLWWRITIEQFVEGAWQRRASYQLGGNMKLSDASGTCLLDPSEAQLELDTTTRIACRAKELQPDHVRALAGLGYDTWHLPRRALLRVFEATLAASQRITVAGVVQMTERPDGERDYRSGPPTWPVFAGEILIASVR